MARKDFECPAFGCWFLGLLILDDLVCLSVPRSGRWLRRLLIERS